MATVPPNRGSFPLVQLENFDLSTYFPPSAVIWLAESCTDWGPNVKWYSRDFSAYAAEYLIPCLVEFATLGDLWPGKNLSFVGGRPLEAA